MTSSRQDIRSQRDLGERPEGILVEPEGRRVVAVIGVDQYSEWPRLDNAVSDALGTRELFLRLGFEELAPPLLNRHASRDAIMRLATEELASLAPEDSLVLFLAGHGHNVTRTIAGGVDARTGYIIPADGAASKSNVPATSWVRVDSWLSELAHLPVRHVLVILDACHSGVALNAATRWRSAVERQDALESLRCRRSRRVITSALENELAMDTGPVPGHSLFTGCLIEGLTGAIASSSAGADGAITGSELGVYVQQRVQSYPGAHQTPDFGAFELDDRGEIVLPIAAGTAAPRRSRHRITLPGFAVGTTCDDAPAVALPAPPPPVTPSSVPARPYDVPHSAAMTSSWPASVVNGATAVALDAEFLHAFADDHGQLADGSLTGERVSPPPRDDDPVPTPLEHEPTSTAIPVYVPEAVASASLIGIPVTVIGSSVDSSGGQ